MTLRVSISLTTLSIFLGRSTGCSSLTNLLKHGVIYDSIISMFNCSKGVESI